MRNFLTAIFCLLSLQAFTAEYKIMKLGTDSIIGERFDSPAFNNNGQIVGGRDRENIYFIDSPNNIYFFNPVPGNIYSVSLRRACVNIEIQM